MVFGGFFHNTTDFGGGPFTAVAPSDGYLVRRAHVPARLLDAAAP